MNRSALLLLGSTGSGKTPLGERIVGHGLWGRRWAHFDFGAQMRRIVAEGPSDAFSPADLDFLAQVLQRGVLLEDKQFALAQRIFRSFLAASGADDDTWIVLNGLPRHVGQAAAIEELATVRAVVELACPAEVIAARIGSDVGGDRAGRADDQPEAIRRKLEIYHARTAPLVEHYRQRSVAILHIDVTATMTDAEMYSRLPPS